MNRGHGNDGYKDYQQIKAEMARKNRKSQKSLSSQPNSPANAQRVAKVHPKPSKSPQELVEGYRQGDKLLVILNYPPAPWRAPQVRSYSDGAVRAYRPDSSIDAYFIRAAVPALRTLKQHVLDWKFNVPYELWIFFFVPRPKKISSPDSDYPMVKPDLVNYTKLLEDCIKEGVGATGAGLIPDDNIVVRHVTEKVYAQPGEEGKVIFMLGPLDKTLSGLPNLMAFLCKHSPSTFRFNEGLDILPEEISKLETPEERNARTRGEFVDSFI